MCKKNLRIVALDSGNIIDRLRLCWSHLENWERLEIVERCKEWLQEANALFNPTTFLSYEDALPVGMIEFLPLRLLRRVKLCPCRVDVDNNEVEERYILGNEFDDYLFISCFLVHKDHQGRGVGKTLLHHFLDSEVFEKSDGALVYVTERDETWSRHIHWPSGPKEFYLKAGFSILQKMRNPEGYTLSIRRKSSTRA